MFYAKTVTHRGAVPILPYCKTFGIGTKDGYEQ